MVKLICYCFDYTDQEIELDLLNNGRTSIMEKILAKNRIDPPLFSFPLGFSGTLAGFTGAEVLIPIPGHKEGATVHIRYRVTHSFILPFF